MKWTKLPTEDFFYQPSQVAFLQAKNSRNCPNCRAEQLSPGLEPGVYLITPPHLECPRCGAVGKRRFDRMTVIAGRRFGKTKLGSIAGVEEATIPNSIGWACAPTVPKLQRYVIPAYQQLIPEEWIQSWNAEFLDLRLKNGSLIHFQTLEHVDQGRGQGLDWLYIDECCELTKEHWDVIRPSLAGDTVAFFTTTPRGEDWVYEELFKPAEEGVPGYWACHAKTAESANPDISTEFLAREKAQMSDLMFRQEYEADFVTFTGAVYGEVLKPSHLLPSDEAVREFIPEWPAIHSSRPLLIGIDTGADHPFGAIKIVSTEKGFVVVDEYLHQGGRPFAEHCAHILQMAGRTANVRFAINKNDKQASIELAQHGIFCNKAENDVMAGTERVKSWLHINKLFFAARNCPLTLKELRAYRYAENTGKDGQARKEKVFKKHDELCDALRYSMMVWPALPKLEAESEKKRDISKLPQEMQDTILHMRKLNEAEEAAAKPAPDVTGDMWASELNNIFGEDFS